MHSGCHLGCFSTAVEAAIAYATRLESLRAAAEEKGEKGDPNPSPSPSLSPSPDPNPSPHPHSTLTLALVLTLN